MCGCMWVCLLWCVCVECVGVCVCGFLLVRRLISGPTARSSAHKSAPLCRLSPALAAAAPQQRKFEAVVAEAHGHRTNRRGKKEKEKEQASCHTPLQHSPKHSNNRRAALSAQSCSRSDSRRVTSQQSSPHFNLSSASRTRTSPSLLRQTFRSRSLQHHPSNSTQTFRPCCLDVYLSGRETREREERERVCVCVRGGEWIYSRSGVGKSGIRCHKI